MIELELYLAVDGGSEILERAIDINQNVIASWNQRWVSIFDSALFDVIITMSTFAAVVAVCVWMVNELKDFDGGDYLFKRSFYTNLMWALFVMAMLVPGGDRLETLVRGLHTFGQEFNQQALEFQLDSIAMEDAIRALVGRGTLQSEISAQMAQCEGLIGERQFACLKDAREQVQGMIDAYEEEWVIDLPGTFVRLENYLTNVIYGTDGPDIVGGDLGNRPIDAAREVAAGEAEGLRGGLPGAISGFFLGTLATIIQSFVQGILLDIQFAFVNLLELSMLLTAMVSPFALALSFLPGTGRPIVAWVIAYISMVMVQFYYNITTGIVAVVVLNSNAHDINGFLIILAIFGPVIAIKLAQGGGIAVFDTLTSGTIGLALASLGMGSKIVSSFKGKK